MYFGAMPCPLATAMATSVADYYTTLAFCNIMTSFAILAEQGNSVYRYRYFYKARISAFVRQGSGQQAYSILASHS